MSFFHIADTVKMFATLSILFQLIYAEKIDGQIVLAGTNDLDVSRRTELVENRRDLSVNLAKIGKFKIYVNSEEIKLGGILILDLGVLLRSNHEIYFPTDLNALISATDEDGNKVNIFGLYSIDFLGSSFIRARDALVSRSFKIVVGCGNGEAKLANSILDSTDSKVLFDNNLFKTQPDACIEVSKTQILDIYGVWESNIVVIPDKKEAVKTATGKLRSNCLKIKVEN